MTLLLALLGFLLGIAAAAGVFLPRLRKEETARAAAGGENALASERLRLMSGRAEEAMAEALEARVKVLDLTSAAAKAEAEGEALRQRLDEQRHLLEEFEAKYTGDFENIARRVLVETSRTIHDEHRGTLQEVLGPLKESIGRFEEKVESTHRDSVRENQSLREQLLQLQQLNSTIGEEARNLTTALRGQAKIRGNWGEMILERILEQSGLMRGREFAVQEQHMTGDGRRLQPDAIIMLPERRHVVIDAKVSLLAYERHCAAADPEEKAAALAGHVEAMRRHVRELSEKRYETLEGLQSPDFVLMFVPVEPAFNDAVNADPSLTTDALARNIVIVSASSLLATLRIIASLWRVERQNRNAVEIAHRAGDLYDKFVSLLGDLQEVGRRIEGVRRWHEAAVAHLGTGKGNIIRRVEELKRLGAHASKAIDPSLLEDERATEVNPVERAPGHMAAGPEGPDVRVPATEPPGDPFKGNDGPEVRTGGNEAPETRIPEKGVPDGRPQGNETSDGRSPSDQAPADKRSTQG
jgi:DNA recombination protein RmuC